MKNLTWQNPEQLFVAQELINKVKSKCCGIKESQIVLYGIDPADGYVWDASLDKLKRDSGYEPEGNIENMIREYADWIISQGK